MFPDDDEPVWHDHTAAQVGTGDNQRIAIILHAADVGENWIPIALEREGGGWTIGEFAAFEGEPPSGEGDEAAIPLDSDGIDFVRIE